MSEEVRRPRETLPQQPTPFAVKEPLPDASAPALMPAATIDGASQLPAVVDRRAIAGQAAPTAPVRGAHEIFRFLRSKAGEQREATVFQYGLWADELQSRVQSVRNWAEFMGRSAAAIGAIAVGSIPAGWAGLVTTSEFYTLAPTAAALAIGCSVVQVLLNEESRKIGDKAGWFKRALDQDERERPTKKEAADAAR